LAWYRFDHLEAYYKVGRYDDVLALAQANLNDGGGQYVEETYYYGGLARLGKGEIDRAISNFDAAIQFNPNFQAARQAKEVALAQRGGG
jgi:tetratricopeptide (TPR) repeat protein